MDPDQARHCVTLKVSLKEVSEKYDFVKKHQMICLFVFVALRPMSTAMVIAGRSVHLSTFFLGRLEQAVNQ